jgi:hypothetical protein
MHPNLWHLLKDDALLYQPTFTVDEGVVLLRECTDDFLAACLQPIKTSAQPLSTPNSSPVRKIIKKTTPTKPGDRVRRNAPSLTTGIYLLTRLREGLLDEAIQGKTCAGKKCTKVLKNDQLVVMTAAKYQRRQEHAPKQVSVFLCPQLKCLTAASSDGHRNIFMQTEIFKKIKVANNLKLNDDTTEEATVGALKSGMQ